MKPRNRCQPGRPEMLWTTTGTTECYGSIRPALRRDHRTTQLLSQLLCRTESQRLRLTEKLLSVLHDENLVFEFGFHRHCKCVTCQTAWCYYSLSFACSCHFHGLWLCFKVTAMSVSTEYLSSYLMTHVVQGGKGDNCYVSWFDYSFVSQSEWACWPEIAPIWGI